MTYSTLKLKVWGERACFTRPELKVERVSYDVMTPSAARGLLEAVFWKPEFSWQVRAIHVLNPIRRFTVRRNETNLKISASTVKKWTENNGHLYSQDEQTQRFTLGLRDVAYIIEADMVLRAHATEDIAKYRDQFHRRVQKGACFQQPYFGCREFVAQFGEPDSAEKPIELTDELGRMLFDMTYPKAKDERIKPKFFNARLENGILHIPQNLYLP